MTLTTYVKFRLGETPRQQAVNFFGRPFGAPSFAQFWWYWNPVYGYYLYYRCYQPLARYLPRSLAVLLTFGVSGLAHDLPFLLLKGLANQPVCFTLTTAFVLLGLEVVLTGQLSLEFSRVPRTGRWLIHGVNLFVCWKLSELLTKSLC